MTLESHDALTPNPNIFKNIFIYTYFNFMYLFTFGCVGSLLQIVGATLCCRARTSHCNDFSSCGARALGL